MRTMKEVEEALGGVISWGLEMEECIRTLVTDVEGLHERVTALEDVVKGLKA